MRARTRSDESTSTIRSLTTASSNELRGYSASTSTRRSARCRAFSWFVDQGCATAKTRGELERLLAVCADELRDMIAVAVGTGVRLDEMLHLQWDDVDLECRLLTICRGRQGTTKSGKLRTVPIGSVLPVLRRRALARAGATIVFPGRKGRVRTKTPVHSAFTAALKSAGLDPTLSWHDLRHTCASWWVVGGGDIFRLSKMLGHADVRITQRTYAHLAPDAWTQDYGRLAFRVPNEPARLYEVRRGEDGKLAGRAVIAAVS